MPHITFSLADLSALSGVADLTIPRIDQLALLVKGELKAKHSTEAEVKVELQDTNRPDTWCVEGIARQIRQHREGAPGDYGFFEADADASHVLEVDASVEQVRPFVAGFLAKGYTVDDDGLKAFISCQEVLSQNYGRKRRDVSIGIYDASSMTFPVRYTTTGRDDSEHAFVPLKPPAEEELQDGAGQTIPAARWEQPWTPNEILRDHPTGRTYAGALRPGDRVPILLDAQGGVLSFPPVINSASLGRVRVGMKDLFVEVTGSVLDQVLLATNILAANLADRGAIIHPVVSRYPFDTPRGREVRAPHPLPDRRTVEVEARQFGELLGESKLAASEIVERLKHFGLSVDEGETLRVTTPAYRADYLHAVDAIEDFAISRGYDAFEPLLPEEFTVGGLAPETLFADVVRDRAIGCGFEEAIGNLLTSVEEIRDRMCLDASSDFMPVHGGKLVKIRNVMNRNYSVVRDWILPTLLEIESKSTSALYPHRVFEVGEACVWDASQNLSSRTEHRLGALVADHQVGFSETQAYMHALLTKLGVSYTLERVEHPSFIPGRAAWVQVGSEKAGLIGEVHPRVLDTWGIYFPVGAFELRLDPLSRTDG